MSEITTKIDAYAAGNLAFAALADFLANFDWTVAEDEDGDPFDEMLDDGGDFPVDGTFDEVTVARDRGKLSDEDYFALLAVHNAED